jgi:Tubulin-tyrosine ligase family
VDENSVTKWDFGNYCKYLTTQGVKYSDIFDSIKDIVIKTLITIQPHVSHAMQRYSKIQEKCYDVYGFDVILDSQLKAYLLEVNICPSLSSSSRLDKRIKTILLSDIFHMIGIKVFDKTYPKVTKKEQNPNDVIMEFEEQKSRRGNFSLIFPTKEAIPKYCKYFEAQSASDKLIWEYLMNNPNETEPMCK